MVLYPIEHYQENNLSSLEHTLWLKGHLLTHKGIKRPQGLQVEYPLLVVDVPADLKGVEQHYAIDYLKLVEHTDVLFALR